MLERGGMDRDIIEIVGIDDLVLQEHLLRKIDTAVDFRRIYEMVDALCCQDNGCPSIDPVVLFKKGLFGPPQELLEHRNRKYKNNTM